MIFYCTTCNKHTVNAKLEDGQSGTFQCKCGQKFHCEITLAGGLFTQKVSSFREESERIFEIVTQDETISFLSGCLERCVRLEDYELAAYYRDRIKDVLNG